MNYVEVIFDVPEDHDGHIGSTWSMAHLRREKLGDETPEATAIRLAKRHSPSLCGYPILSTTRLQRQFPR